MGHKPWDRAWKRVEKARDKRRWQRDARQYATRLANELANDPAILDECCPRCGSYDVVIDEAYVPPKTCAACGDRWAGRYTRPLPTTD